jgi:two-component system, OmpR family, sensor histidine kinase KdpD
VNLHVRRWRETSSSELVVAAFASAGAVPLVTAAIAALKQWVPVLSLGALYVFAVLPVAIAWGIVFAVPVAVASMLAFNWFFLPPTHTFTLSDSENWLALAVYLVVAVVASELAVRARRRARLAEQREREAALLASMATSFLHGRELADELDRISAGVAEVLRLSHARIELADESADAHVAAQPLVAEGRRVATLVSAVGRAVDADVEERFLPALASLLALALDRERLQREAFEAEALRRSDAVKTAVLRAVSHDLRSPLTAIAAAASGLASPRLRLAESDRAELVETIRSESSRLDRLVSDLLDLSRLQAGAAHPRRALWSVEELIGLALRQLDADERVDLELPAELPPVDVDGVQIQHALANVLENALHAAPSQTAVRVVAEQADGEVVMRVIDQGPGIPPDELQQVFEPFRRGASGVERQGSGLGLAIARGFVEANGGRIWAEPFATGAQLAIALPQSSAESQ